MADHVPDSSVAALQSINVKVKAGVTWETAHTDNGPNFSEYDSHSSAEAGSGQMLSPQGETQALLCDLEEQYNRSQRFLEDLSRSLRRRDENLSLDGTKQSTEDPRVQAVVEAVPISTTHDPPANQRLERLRSRNSSTALLEVRFSSNPMSTCNARIHPAPQPQPAPRSARMPHLSSSLSRRRSTDDTSRLCFEALDIPSMSTAPQSYSSEEGLALSASPLISRVQALPEPRSHHHTSGFLTMRPARDKHLSDKMAVHDSTRNMLPGDSGPPSRPVSDTVQHLVLHEVTDPLLAPAISIKSSVQQGQLTGHGDSANNGYASLATNAADCSDLAQRTTSDPWKASAVTSVRAVDIPHTEVAFTLSSARAGMSAASFTARSGRRSSLMVIPRTTSATSAIPAVQQLQMVPPTGGFTIMAHRGRVAGASRNSLELGSTSAPCNVIYPSASAVGANRGHVGHAAASAVQEPAEWGTLDIIAKKSPLLNAREQAGRSARSSLDQGRGTSVMAGAHRDPRRTSMESSPAFGRAPGGEARPRGQLAPVSGDGEQLRVPSLPKLQPVAAASSASGGTLPSMAVSQDPSGKVSAWTASMVQTIKQRFRTVF